MVWLLKRLLGPLVLGGVACSVVLLVRLIAMKGLEAVPRFTELPLLLLFIFPFETAGLILLLPIGLFVCDFPLHRGLRSLLLACIGAALGIAVVLPISETPPPSDLAVAAICGAVSALIWLSINQIQSTAEP